MTKNLTFGGFQNMLNENRSHLLRRRKGVGNLKIINILVCDDEATFAERLSELLHQQPTPPGISISITENTQAADLTDHQLARFQIMFLDIDMGNCSGMDIARRVRKLHLNTVLIFVTNYPQFSLEGYEVRAFRYLLKNDLDQKLPGYYRDALAEIPKDEEALSFCINGEAYNVAYNNILYLESRQRIIYLHTVKPERFKDHFYGTMEKLAEELYPFGFLRIQKSYLVNMAHIRKLNYDKVQLDNGEDLPVSQKRFAAIKAIYLDWRCKQ